MFKRTTISRCALLALGGILLVPAAAVFAQDQRIEVTGSRIKRIDAETASPVQVLTREDIERTGKQSIQEVLRGLTADGVGSIPSSFTNGFASGSAAVSLRGLGVNSTLVLVNGRRMTTYGLADDGTRNFVDLNSIPMEAIDRIEVLKDGASAIYGADAVGGVVNVILRKNYTGGSIGATYGQTGKSDGQTTRAFGTFGFGNLDTDKYNVFVSVEASQQKNILSIDRGFIGAERPHLPRLFRHHEWRESSVFRCRADVQLAVRCDSRPCDKRACERDSLRGHLDRPKHRLVPLQLDGRYRGATRHRPVELLRSRHSAVLARADGLCGVGILQYQVEVQRHAGRKQRHGRLLAGRSLQSACHARPHGSAGCASRQSVWR